MTQRTLVRRGAHRGLAVWACLLACALAGGEASATCVAPPADLIGWWRAEGNALDAVVGNHGSLGSTTFTAGEVGQGFEFTPPAGVSIPHSSSFNPQSPGFTAEFWVKGIHNQPDALAALFEKSHGPGNAGWAFQLNSTSGILGFAIGNGTSFPEIPSLSDILSGTFRHVAGTWDGTTMRLYVDGVFQGSAAITTPAGNSGAVNIGFWAHGARRFRGVIDEPSLYNRALSGTEIQDIFAAGVDGKCSFCGNGTVNPDETCDDGNNLNGDCCSATCEPETVGNPCLDDGITCTLDQCNTTGRCIHPSDGTCPCVPPPADAVAWWRAEDDTTDAVDGNDGTLVAPATYAAGRVGQAFDFNAGGHVGVLHNANLNLVAPGFTAEFWLKGIHNQAESFFTPIDKSHSNLDFQGWAIQGNSSSGRPSFIVGSSPTTFAAVDAGVDLLDDTFHHVAGVWNGSSMTIYVDGVAYQTAALSTPNNNTRPLQIGKWASGRQFKGLVDEVTIYNRGLSAAEIGSIFSAGGAGKCGPCGNGALDAGEQCDDGNETNADGCDSMCSTESGYSCLTPGSPCEDIDECTLDTDNCDANAECTNLPGSFSCACNSGFDGDGVDCADVDECDLETDNCDANAACTNESGSFSCACNLGYQGDGVSCDLPHYLGYKITAPKKDELGVEIANQFPRDWVITVNDVHLSDSDADDPEAFLIKKAKSLYNPAQKNLEPAPDLGGLHYLRYQAKPGKESVAAPVNGEFVSPAAHIARRWELDNQLGSINVVSKKVTAVLVPANKDPNSPPPPPDDANHFVCYQVKPTADITDQTPETDPGAGVGKLRKDLQAYLVDQFDDCALNAEGEPSFAGSAAAGKCLFDLKSVRELCNPMDKSPVEPPRETSATITTSSATTTRSLLCYQVKLAKSFKTSATAALADATIGEKIDPGQAKHVKRSTKTGNPLRTAPGNQFPNPVLVNSSGQQFACVPTEVTAVVPLPMP